MSAGRWTSCTTISPTVVAFARSTSSTRTRASATPSKLTRRFAGGRVVRVLDALIAKHGRPSGITVDNGPEFISQALDRWAFANGVALHFIQPGKPVQNAYVESFNGRFRDECLSQAHYPTLARARVEIELWRVDYNRVRPHSSLDYRTPEAFGELARAYAHEAPRGLPSAFVAATACHLASDVDCNVGDMR